ncbi:Outer membrane lipoprotein-sorting protein [Salinihabitans flavidus]|uniref:Outer membrane lipoprotein-sorting protein n=2 Tax=Salinihabitans flavidus TaxID=569882 RepID=A0A1H8MUT5_9RHOB|nr:Outer membrane lipoprotein-sorting protein [Salinihabitans flavidus]
MKSTLLAAGAVLAMAFPAAAEKLPLSAISSYLNSLTTAQAGFTQLNEDGTRSAGQLYIKRPGKMRFEYDPPNEGLVMAGSGAVAIFDGRSNQPPETYPLKRTPLSIILAPNVNLGRERMVIGHTEDGIATVVTAQDPDNPDYGTIKLYFTANPVTLRQWVINNGDGGTVTVRLGELKTGISLSNDLFNIRKQEGRPER